jgi:tRNA (cmo5U34)-methyltransferase
VHPVSACIAAAFSKVTRKEKIMNSDNTTSHSSSSYDLEILKTIPYYDSIHDETLKFVKAYDPNPHHWLDTGCGTGTFALKVLEQFDLDEFVLADPSNEMLAVAEGKLAGKNAALLCSDSASLGFEEGHFDVITAIQAHHYLSGLERKKAAVRCHGMLKDGGIFVTFENIRPICIESVNITKEYWKLFQIEHGKTPLQAENHLNRFDKEYFPITVNEHLELYADVGFKTVDMFWKTYMQAGFFCIK